MNALVKLWNVIVVVLALNFIGMAVAVVMLAQTAGLDRYKLAQIRAILFDEEEDHPQPDLPEAPPAELSAMEQLMLMLEARSPRPTEQRVEELRETFDQRTAALARARRELSDRQRQVDAAGQRLVDERQAFAGEKAAWEAQVAAATIQARDQGFRESLSLYQQMPPRQAKAVLLKLEDEVVLAYLRAMDTRAAGRILREFKEDPETERVKSILERMRLGEGILGSATTDRGAGTAG